jgi:hypothetical protein
MPVFSNFLSQIDSHNKQLVRVSIGTANMIAYFQDVGLAGCFSLLAGLKTSGPTTL